MIGRVAWIVVLALVGVITAQLQIDRQSDREPDLASLVAEPFRGYAQRAITREALLGDDPARAVAEAQRLVARRPVPAEHLALLAQAHVKAGQADRGPALIASAALRGWRDPWVQDGMARLALNTGDIPEATRRFTALLVLESDNTALLRDLAEEIFTEPAGPATATLAELLAGTQRWVPKFVRRGHQVMPPAAYVDVVIAAKAGGARLDCALLRGALRAVMRKDESAGARLLAAAEPDCPDIAKGLKPAGRRGRKAGLDPIKPD
ncbi:MAG: hypothetical protein ACK4IS_11215 [Erythrobacter sp.]